MNSAAPVVAVGGVGVLKLWTTGIPAVVPIVLVAVDAVVVLRAGVRTPLGLRADGLAAVAHGERAAGDLRAVAFE